MAIRCAIRRKCLSETTYPTGYFGGRPPGQVARMINAEYTKAAARLIAMSDVLFIKTSSLGDVIHHMPAVSEARARRPGDRFAWVVEEAFAPLVRLHPAVDEVIPVAARRWRGMSLLKPSTWTQIGDFRHVLRSRRYDAIIDTQGLFFKSALIARAAHGVRHGYDDRSIKEPTASRLYDVRHRVDRNLHAVARNRMLTALALGYTMQGEPDYGLDAAALAPKAASSRYGVLLHATARQSKEWPAENWQGLAAELGGAFDVVLPWGTAREAERSRHIATGVARARGSWCLCGARRSRTRSRRYRRRRRWRSRDASPGRRASSPAPPRAPTWPPRSASPAGWARAARWSRSRSTPG